MQLIENPLNVLNSKNILKTNKKIKCFIISKNITSKFYFEIQFVYLIYFPNTKIQLTKIV